MHVFRYTICGLSGTLYSFIKFNVPTQILIVNTYKGKYIFVTYKYIYKFNIIIHVQTLQTMHGLLIVLAINCIISYIIPLLFIWCSKPSSNYKRDHERCLRLVMYSVTCNIFILYMYMPYNMVFISSYFI